MRKDREDKGLSEALRVMGSLRALGEAAGVTAQAVALWERVPIERVPAVELATGISREVLRPDIFAVPRPPKRLRQSAHA